MSAELTPPTPIRQGMDSAPYWPGPGHEAAADVANRVGLVLVRKATSPFASGSVVRLDPTRLKDLRSLVVEALADCVADGLLAQVVSVDIGQGEGPGQIVIVCQVWLVPPYTATVAEIAIPMLFS